MIIFSLLNQLVDLLVSPFHGLDPVPQLVLLSLLATVLLLLVFKKLSNQETIKLHKNKIFGNFLEIAIYRDQFRRSVICQSNVLKHNLLYLKAVGMPLLLMMAPMSLLCLQLEYRLGYQALKPGTSFIIEAQIAGAPTDTQTNRLDAVTIDTSATIALESPALRIPSTGQVFWQARVIAAGSPNFIDISLAGKAPGIRKELAVNRLTSRLTPETTTMRSLRDILVSGEDPTPPAAGINLVRVSYLPAEYQFFQWSFSPIVYFFILTLLFGLLLKPFMKVTI